ncbi:aminoglycoside 3'-phosphotransferase [Nonomuraea sp. MCN248]|uniref:Aminoglycoside 3'-phosphotransferase n=1 Tax=Nonomuraea corallina TaxID=2989783 RepID=A0ABT4SN06_9ACTN|nr:aminoglycoside 3'-phosphotransferase [Nonomuraea corallina]MDA0638618.1 aminoglycoside 3'-phosphotransferase [Nonomuraea corallina]
MRFPENVFDLVGGEDAIWSDDHAGLSGETLRVTGPRGEFFIKRGQAAAAEHERLLWLKRWANVPDVVAFEDDVLVLAEVGWRDLERKSRPPEAGTILGGTLRALHAIPVAECPFDERLDVKLARAAERVRAGLVDPADLGDEHAGRTPEEVLAWLLAERPAGEDLVVTHGDFTPANVLASPSGEAVLIDVPALGVADRYVDLAVALRALEGRAAADFLAAYGLAEADAAKLAYYRLLAEVS